MEKRRMENNHNNSSQNYFFMNSYPSFGLTVDNMNDNRTVMTQNFHYHDCYELYYIYSGECYFFVKDRSFLVQKGNIVLINAYDIHCATITPNQKTNRIVLFFRKAFLEEFLGTVGTAHILACFQKGVPIIKASPQEQHSLEALLQTMVAERQNKEDDYYTYLCTSLIQLLIVLNRHQDHQESSSLSYANSSHKIISEITGYINNNYAKDLTLTSISELFYISPYYFSRIFKKHTGFTFIDYLNGVRIKEAQKLLLNTQMSISDIAEAIGYKSNTHFGRVFKSITGMTPLAYKNRRKSAALTPDLFQEL